MSGAHKDPILDQALTELERLVVVWGDLTATGGANPFISNLVDKKVTEMYSRCMDAIHVISFDDIRRLFDIYNGIWLNGDAEASGIDDISLFIAKKLEQRINSHPSRLKSDAPRRSALELFEDLEFWSALKTMPKGTFVLWGPLTGAITKIISFNVAACPIDGVAILGSLRVVEIGAKLMRALPRKHHSKILRAINSHMMRMTMADSQRGDGHAQISAQSAVIGDGGIPQAGALAPELTTAKNTHILVTADLQTEIRRLQEQAVQYEATITELNEDKEIYTQENIQYEATIAKLNEDKKFYTQENVDLEGQVHDLQSEMVELKSENAALRQLDSKHQSSIHKLNEEIGTLRQTVIDQKYAHDTDDKIYDGSFQSRAEKLSEELAEAEEDKAALARDNARLAVEKASAAESLADVEEDNAALARDNARLAVEKAGAEKSLAEAEDSKTAMSNEIHELGMTNDRLEQQLQDANDSLEEAEDDRATLSMIVEKLTSEKGRLEQELKDALEEAEDDRATLGRNVGKLTSEKARLEKELAGAQGILRQISTFSASIRPIATDDISQMSNADADTDTASSTGVLTPPSSTQTTPS